MIEGIRKTTNIEKEKEMKKKKMRKEEEKRLRLVKEKKKPRSYQSNRKEQEGISELMKRWK